MKVLALKSVPEVAPGMSASDRRRAWLLMNRRPIGMVILALSSFVRIGMSFAGHTDLADVLKGVADLFIAGGGALAAAGASKSDEFHEDKLHAEIRTRSGQIPAVRTRASDEFKTPRRRSPYDVQEVRR